MYPKIYLVFCDPTINTFCQDFNTTNLDALGLSHYQEIDFNVYTSFSTSVGAHMEQLPHPLNSEKQFKEVHTYKTHLDANASERRFFQMSYLQGKWKHYEAQGPYYPYLKTEAFDYEEIEPLNE